MEDDPLGIVCGKDVSCPVVTTVSNHSGRRSGGNTIIIYGKSLDIGDLVVKFNGNQSPFVSNRTPISAEVVVPMGSYKLNVVEHLYSLTLTLSSGSLAINETVMAPSGTTGIIRLISGSTYMVAVQTLIGDVSSLLGVSLTGGSNGAVAQVVSAILPEFNEDELAIGFLSNSSGRVRGAELLALHAPSGPFAPNELVKGSLSGAVVKLSGSPAYSGLVNITVENEHCAAHNISCFAGAYTYE